MCIDNYGGLVAGIARRYLKSSADVDDLVQEIFTELWRKADRYDPSRSKESTFIGVLARRRSIDSVRKLSRQPELKPLTEDMDFEAVSDPSRGAFDSEQLRAALRALAPKTQELFHMHFHLGMTHPEIAEKIDLPLGTVKTKLRRGLLEIRNSIQAEQGKEALS